MIEPYTVEVEKYSVLDGIPMSFDRRVGLDDRIVIDACCPCPKLPFIPLIPVVPEIFPCIALLKLFAFVVHFLRLPKPYQPRGRWQIIIKRQHGRWKLEGVPASMLSHKRLQMPDRVFIENCLLLLPKSILVKGFAGGCRVLDASVDDLFALLSIPFEPRYIDET